MKPGVYITVDVECSLGGAWSRPDRRPVPPSLAIMGRYDGRELGIPLIVGMLERNGLSATFFVEVFNEELGEGYGGQTEKAVQYLLDRGQDVQLHVHPCHKQLWLRRRGLEHSTSDNIADLDAAEQIALLGEGSERLSKWTGKAPVAFRAGNMGASEEVLPRLAEVGIKIDSSYAFPFAGGQCRFKPDAPYNGSRWYGDVLELALSGFYQRRLPGLKPAKPLDPVAVSFEECREAIRGICGAGADAVVVLHSFSLFKVRNVQYDRGRLDRIVARRFRRLCEWLARHGQEYPVRTFTGLAEAIRESRYEAKAVPPCRLSGARALARKAVQFINGFYWT